MSEQVLIQFRADKELKQDVVEIYESMGLDLPTAFRMFMYRTKAVNGLPFPAVVPSASLVADKARSAYGDICEQAKDLPEMSLEEINAEIREARKSKRG